MPSLTVINAAQPHDNFTRENLGGQLAQLDVGEVRMSRHDRLLYSTDASLYQVEPLAVVIPEAVRTALIAVLDEF